MLIDILLTLLCWYHQSRYGRWGLNAPARQRSKTFFKYRRQRLWVRAMRWRPPKSGQYPADNALIGGPP